VKSHSQKTHFRQKITTYIDTLIEKRDHFTKSRTDFQLNLLAYTKQIFLWKTIYNFDTDKKTYFIAKKNASKITEKRNFQNVVTVRKHSGKS
jgi:hypothetical protein